MVAGSRIHPRKSLLIAEQQRLVRGVEFRRPQFGMRLRVKPDGAHETERFGDAVSDLLVLARRRAVLDKTQHPAMRVFEIGVAAIGEGADQVQCCR